MNAATPEPRVQATTYEVSILDGDDINQHLYAIEVQYRGTGRWAVVHHSYCLGTDGEWDFGVKEYDRGDDWLNSHRFDLDTALRLAKEAAPRVVVNGRTALDAYRVRLAACARCHTPFRPDDPQPDGRGTDDGLHCRRCTAHCRQNTGPAHECGVCR